MRHRVYGRHLGRNKDERTSLFKSLVRSLILSGKIETTQAKAKAIKGLVDKIITQAKSPTTVKLVNQFLVDKNIQEKLMSDLIPRLQERTSGYTSIVQIGRRVGDGSAIVRMSLIVGKGKGVSEKDKEKELKVINEEVKEEEPKVEQKGAVKPKAKSKK